jgi:hypothetical protein
MAKPEATLRYLCAPLLVGGILLGSCSEIERGRVHNETGAPIVIRLEADRKGGADRGDVLVTLKPGQSRTFMGGDLRHNQLPVTAGRCTYVYVLDGSEFWDLREAGLVFPIEMDIKRDLSLDLRSEATERRDFRRGKAFGFPRRPMSKTCP